MDSDSLAVLWSGHTFVVPFIHHVCHKTLHTRGKQKYLHMHHSCHTDVIFYPRIETPIVDHYLQDSLYICLTSLYIDRWHQKWVWPPFTFETESARSCIWSMCLLTTSTDIWSQALQTNCFNSSTVVGECDWHCRMCLSLSQRGSIGLRSGELGGW